jgi:cob(I)alamin adenosyltransferase
MSEVIAMYDRPQLGLDQVQAAMDAMLEQATKEPDRPVAIAIVDEQGNVLSYAHMDKCRTLPRQLAIKKAYTAAVRTVDSGAYAASLVSGGRIVSEMGDANLVAVQGGRIVSEMGDANLVAVQGGVVIIQPGDGVIMGGIGVSGLSAQEDEDLGRVGVQALNL